jgi:hypothetical protein
MTKEVIASLERIFSKVVLAYFGSDAFLPYRFQGNKRKSQTGVSAKPEEEGDVQGGLRESLSGGTNLTGATNSGTRTIDLSEKRISDVCELSGVANHLVVTSLLLGRQGKLVPDVHPVTILAVNSLTTDLDLDLSDELLTGVVQPTVR